MDDLRLGRAVRMARVRLRKRQEDVAREARCSQSQVSRIERGRLDQVSVALLRRVLKAVGILLELRARWNGGELDRLLAAGHSQMHDELAAMFDGLPPWLDQPEVSFAVAGERGFIDILAWHPGRRMLLIIEIKTELVDVQDLIGVLDRKERLAMRIARERGWDPVAVSVWVVMAEDHTNRRRVQAHAHVLRAAFPSDGRRMRGWLRDPAVPIRALSFWSSPTRTGTRRGAAPVRRVTRRPPRTATR